MTQIQVNSEIGHLKSVIIHTPGREVEKMTPENAERALYSDILNLSVANDEYSQFKGILSRYAQCFEVKDLLTDIFQDHHVQDNVVRQMCENENIWHLSDFLIQLSPEEAARQLIEGVEMSRNTLTRYLSNERYSLHPLHNFFFTRDASMSIHSKVAIGRMASHVRKREALIMENIFKIHPQFKAETIQLKNDFPESSQISVEGGDVLVARHDVLLIGLGARTTASGIDHLIESILQNNIGEYHIIIQELPKTPESFIHLDMVFTFLDRDKCMVYEPVILSHNRFRTIHIELRDSKVKSIRDKANLPDALAQLKFDLKPIKCGGTDLWSQEREQWHSGANFLSLAPGVVVGYERNIHTLEQLSMNGFDIVRAKDIIDGRVDLPQQNSVITIAGSELARGGGGARCMSMPVSRLDVSW